MSDFEPIPMHSARLVWLTPDAEALIGKIARVSNPKNEDNPNVTGLLKYLIKHKHWSPFEMCSMCVEIKTTRAISPQILRHRSASAFKNILYAMQYPLILSLQSFLTFADRILTIVKTLSTTLREKLLTIIENVLMLISENQYNFMSPCYIRVSPKSALAQYYHLIP